jgi:hypothetical protein
MRYCLKFLFIAPGNGNAQLGVVLAHIGNGLFTHKTGSAVQHTIKLAFHTPPSMFVNN